MKILVSACLLGQNCKYNGGNNLCPSLPKLLRGHEVLAVCPEVLGGLPVPRPCIEIQNGRAMNILGEDVTELCRCGIQKALMQMGDQPADLALLQSRSPTCGVRQIYDGTFSGNLIAGQGFFARKLAAHGIRLLDADDIRHQNETELRTFWKKIMAAKDFEAR